MNSQTEGSKATADGTAEGTPEIDVRRVLHQQLASLQQAGVKDLPRPSGKYQFEWMALEDPAAAGRTNAPSSNARPAATAAPRSSQPATASAESKPQPQTDNLAPPSSPGSEQSLPYSQSLPLAQRKQQLTVLNDLVAGCTRCDQLVQNRTQTVFGTGDPTARLVFVGEGPGADEDRTGEPFVGAAGQLLTKILDACQLSREQVYILNAVKCRPPRNRNPTEGELTHCWGYARQQLEILQPEFICCLGSVAAKTLLGTKQPLGRLRQQFHQYRGSRVIATYHPAYLLRTPAAKRHVWDDMKLLMKAMGVDL